jgi:hypothetical protein
MYHVQENEKFYSNHLKGCISVHGRVILRLILENCAVVGAEGIYLAQDGIMICRPIAQTRFHGDGFLVTNMSP